MNFEEAERRYEALVSQWNSRQISAEDFKRALAQLRVQGPDGSWWHIHGHDGSWLHWNGVEWVAATPPHRQAPAAPPATTPARTPVAEQHPVAQERPPKRRRWLRSCLILLLLFVCGLSALVAAGYLAVRSGRVSALQLQAQLSGVASITVYNLAEEAVTIRINQLDGGENAVSRDSQTVDPFDSGGYGGLPVGLYLLEFQGAGLPDQSCRLQADRNDVYTFVIVPRGITVVNERADLRSAEDLEVATSPLCQQ